MTTLVVHEVETLFGALPLAIAIPLACAVAVPMVLRLGVIPVCHEALALARDWRKFKLDE